MSVPAAAGRGGGYARISPELLLLKRLIVTCDNSEAAETCLGEIPQYFEEFEAYSTHNKGEASWVTIDAAKLEATEGLQAMRDPHGQLYDYEPYMDGFNPIEATRLGEFFKTLLQNLEDVVFPDIHRDYCEIRWDDRRYFASADNPTDMDDCGDHSECLDFCVEHVADQGYVNHWPECVDGCGEYFDDVQSAWFGVCRQPDYLFVSEPANTHICGEYVDLELDGASVEVDLYRDVHWETEGALMGGCLCEDPVPLAEPTVTETIAYSPPAYLTQTNSGQVSLHVPVPFEVRFEDAVLHANLNASLDGCPAIPVDMDTFLGWLEAREVAEAANDDDRGDNLNALINTHDYIPPIIIDGEEVFDAYGAQPYLEAARAAFDAEQGDWHSEQSLQLDITMEATLEYVFPLELERNWQWAALYWEENAVPLPLLHLDLDDPVGRASTGALLSIDSIDFAVDWDAGATQIENVAGLDGCVVEDELRTRLEGDSGSFRSALDRALRQAGEAVPEMTLPLVRGDELVTQLRNPVFDPDDQDVNILDYDPAQLQPDLARALVAEGGGNPYDPNDEMHTGNGLYPYPPSVTLAPAELRAVLHWNDALGQCEPLDHFAYHMLVEFTPEELLIRPRWYAMDILWRETICGQTPDTLECWWSMIATRHSTVEHAEEPITREDDTILCEDADHLYYDTFDGFEALLLFEPESRPPDMDPRKLSNDGGFDRSAHGSVITRI